MSELVENIDKMSVSDNTQNTNGTKEVKKQVVDPWTVESEGDIDYERLIRDFGSQKISDELIARMERITGKKAHRFLLIFLGGPLAVDPQLRLTQK